MDKNQFAAFLACAVVPPIMQQIQQKRKSKYFGIDQRFLSFKGLRAFGKRGEQALSLQPAHALQYVFVGT